MSAIRRLRPFNRRTVYVATLATTIRAISGLSLQTPSLRMTKSAGSKTWPLTKSSTARSTLGHSGWRLRGHRRPRGFEPLMCDLDLCLRRGHLGIATAGQAIEWIALAKNLSASVCPPQLPHSSNANETNVTQRRGGLEPPILPFAQRALVRLSYRRTMSLFEQAHWHLRFDQS